MFTSLQDRLQLGSGDCCLYKFDGFHKGNGCVRSQGCINIVIKTVDGESVETAGGIVVSNFRMRNVHWKLRL